MQETKWATTYHGLDRTQTEKIGSKRRLQHAAAWTGWRRRIWSRNAWDLPLNLQELRQELRQASSTDTMATQGNTHVRAKQLQNILDGDKLHNEVMSAFCRLLDNGNNKRHYKNFKPGLYEALSLEGQRGKTIKENKDAARRYSQGIDIYQYEVILLPIWIDKHWTTRKSQ